MAVASAGAHALVLAGSQGSDPVRLLVLAAMGMACLPCALHLLLLPRRRVWVRTAVVSAAMLAAHPLLASGHGAHGTGPATAVTALAALGLALALTALVLGARARRAGG